MKQRLNKNTPGILPPAAFPALLALLFVPLFFSGCNSGLGVLTYLLDDDKEANLTAAEGVAVVFDGFEDASNRKDPRAAVLRFRLESDSGGLANANISWSLDGLVFNPMTFVDPTPESFELAEKVIFFRVLVFCGRLAKIRPEMNDSDSLSDHYFFYRIKKFVFKKKLEV